MQPLATSASLTALLLASASWGQTPVTPPGSPVAVSVQSARSLADLMKLTNDDASFDVLITTDTGKTGFVEGERFRIEIVADAACYVTVLEEGPDGTISIVAPTADADRQLYLKKDETLRLPLGDEQTGPRFRAMPPHGRGRMKVIATLDPLPLPAAAPGASDQPGNEKRNRKIRELLDGTKSLSTKGIGVDRGGDALSADRWTTDEIDIVTGADAADLAKREKEPARVELPSDLHIPRDKIRPTTPSPAPRPHRANPQPPLHVQSGTDANDAYKKEWESTLAQLQGSKGIGGTLVAPRGALQPRRALDPASDLIVVRAGAPAGSKAIGGKSTELVPLIPAGSKSTDLSDAAIAKRAAELKASDPSIVAVIPNRTWQVFRATQATTLSTQGEFDPKAPFRGLQWHLNNHVNGGHDIRYFLRAANLVGLVPVPIGLVDQGVHLNEARLKPYVWTNPGEIPGNGIDDDSNGYVDDVHGWNFASNSAELSTADDQHNHGTYCMSIMAGCAPSLPNYFFGVGYNLTVIPAACVAFDKEKGTATGSILATFDAMQYAAEQGAKVLNLSLGAGTTAEDIRRINTHPVWDYLEQKGVLLVIAAGNENVDIDVSPVAPACIDRPNTIVVMATDPSGAPARGWNPVTNAWQQYSNWGRENVDIAAPGTMVLGIPFVDATSYDDGTSYATPIVAATAAIVWAQHPEWDYALVKRAILESARQVDCLDDKCQTGGMLDLDAAMGWKP